MSEQSAFDRQHIAELTQVHHTGLLEQLRVPPETAAWMRRYQRELWAGLACCILAFVVWALYDNYRTTKAEKAAAALHAAMAVPVESRAARLAEMITQYGSTIAGTWARIEQAQLALDRGDAAEALALFEQVRKNTAGKSPLLPLLHYGIATAQERTGKIDEAMQSYRSLSEFKGFAPLAWMALGRLYEARNEREQAVQMYEKYLAAAPEAGGQAVSGDGARDLATARLRDLKSGPAAK